jgi:hypothetical protein
MVLIPLLQVSMQVEYRKFLNDSTVIVTMRCAAI